MEITRVIIKNFRSIKDADIFLGHTTVLIGPNNVGKTAILDAIRIALTRRWGQRGTGFVESDIHLPSGITDPKQGKRSTFRSSCKNAPSMNGATSSKPRSTTSSKLMPSRVAASSFSM